MTENWTFNSVVLNWILYDERFQKLIENILQKMPVTYFLHDLVIKLNREREQAIISDTMIWLLHILAKIFFLFQRLEKLVFKEVKGREKQPLWFRASAMWRVRLRRVNLNKKQFSILAGMASTPFKIGRMSITIFLLPKLNRVLSMSQVWRDNEFNISFSTTQRS